MIPDKVKSVIQSCDQQTQLYTCRKWVDALYNFGTPANVVAHQLIDERSNQLTIAGSKTAIRKAMGSKFPTDDEQPTNHKVIE